MADRRRIAPILGVLAVVIGLLLAVAGCGGAGEGDASAASITKAEFVKKASAACATIHRKAGTEFSAYMRGESPAGVSDIGDLSKKFVIAPKRQEVEEFVALGTPSGSEGQLKAVIAAFEEGIEEAEKDPAAAAQNSTAAFGTPEKLAAEYGLKGC